MIRQTLVDERVSALHHHTLQSPGDSDGEMSKLTPRRVPPPIASRIVIKKNASLLPTADETTLAAPVPPVPTVDPRSRVELLERNLRYVQQQHELTLADLHNEISRLQEENRNLHFHMIDLRPSSGSHQKPSKPETTTPSTRQLAELSHKEPVLEPRRVPSTEKRLQEVQRLHFEQQIDELQTRLIETDEKNSYLMRTIDQLNQVSSLQTQSATSPAVSFLLPDPHSSTDLNIRSSTMQNDMRASQQAQSDVTDTNYQEALTAAYDQRRQQFQEITKLRAVLREILQAERLSVTSKLLVHDCLANTNASDMSQQQRTVGSPLAGQKTSSYRPELPVRRVNLSPPQFISPRLPGHARLAEQRRVLPPIQTSGGVSALQDSSGAAGGPFPNPLGPTNIGLQGQPAKFGETPIARRERRTQELQRTRLTRNLYH